MNVFHTFNDCLKIKNSKNRTLVLKNMLNYRNRNKHKDIVNFGQLETVISVYIYITYLGEELY